MILPETKAVYRIYVAFHCCVENAKRKDEDKCRTTEHKNSQMNTEQQDAISPSLQRNNRPNNLLFCEHGLFALNNFGFIVHQYNSILILCAPLDGLAVDDYVAKQGLQRLKTLTTGSIQYGLN
ncbi:hypothetical protein Tsp_13334 [Trichinella spiralis]|uniref:hypothetical protein n=1 Tax=Trichinella spiralis TaxID=6334 RepID=UPI0001EFE7D2|nr:hypothetical protein Tsp_13334 [Trichinella spiralis]